jgi:hypothetical protein
MTPGAGCALSPAERSEAATSSGPVKFGNRTKFLCGIRKDPNDTANNRRKADFLAVFRGPGLARFAFKSS